MKLYNDEIEFEVETTNRITPFIKSQFIKAFKNYTEDEISNTKANKLTSLQGIKEDQTTEIFKELSVFRQFSDAETTNDTVYLNAFKAIVNTKGLTDLQKELIATEALGEFWQNQDILSIKGEVNGFCLKISI
jgi:hypothetical protein